MRRSPASPASQKLYLYRRWGQRGLRGLWHANGSIELDSRFGSLSVWGDARKIKKHESDVRNCSGRAGGGGGEEGGT